MELLKKKKDQLYMGKKLKYVKPVLNELPLSCLMGYYIRMVIVFVIGNTNRLKAVVTVMIGNYIIVLEGSLYSPRVQCNCTYCMVR